MPKQLALWPSIGEAGPAPFDADALTAAMQVELAALAAIDAEYAQRQLLLETWAGPQAAKERLAREVEACHTVSG